jgi:hypothetical protein
MPQEQCVGPRGLEADRLSGVPGLPVRLNGRLALECAPGRSVADSAAHEARVARCPHGMPGGGIRR